jgi:hypothetical protein
MLITRTSASSVNSARQDPRATAASFPVSKSMSFRFRRVLTQLLLVSRKLLKVVIRIHQVTKAEYPGRFGNIREVEPTFFAPL